MRNLAALCGLMGWMSLVLLIESGSVCGQEARTAKPAIIRVRVPTQAQVLLDGEKTTQTGADRRFESPPLPPGKSFTYSVRAMWKEGGKEVVRKAEAVVRAGME